MEKASIGIIGGSGIYSMEDLKDVVEVKMDTPFGEPSDAYVVGTVEGRRVAFIARHGRGHRIIPSEINFRANIFGFKLLGVERIVAAGAVGSMREHIIPLDIVLPDQFIDRTCRRPSTFFGNGIVGHITFAEPICRHLKDSLREACLQAGARIHNGGVYLCMEGPQFSTKAESLVYRSWGVDVIGMTNLQEAKLAREAEICFATMALVTDYDCWHESEESVTIDAVLQNLKKNSMMAKEIVKRLMRVLPEKRECGCSSALKDAIITDRSMIPEELKRRLFPLIGKYI
ncbi:MAG: S-methyl-5'-thioadenosine phosphorylase [Acidobacteriota bacterium]